MARVTASFHDQKEVNLRGMHVADSCVVFREGSPTSLDCTLAGYFARLVGILLTRCPEQTLAFFEVHTFNAQSHTFALCDDEPIVQKIA